MESREGFDHQIGEDSELFGAPSCQSIRCHTRNVVDLIFDVCGMLMDNPIQVWMRWFKYASATIHLQLPAIWRLLGVFLTLLMLNLVALIYLRVADVLVHIWKFMKAVFGLPLCVLARRTVCGVYTFLVSLPKAEKKEKKEGSLKNANAIYQSGN